MLGKWIVRLFGLSMIGVLIYAILVEIGVIK